jgi:hypothetical protein
MERKEIYFTVSMKKGYKVRYIDPETLEVCSWPGPFKDPCDASVQFGCFVGKGRETWLTSGGFKQQVKQIATDRKKLEEWNAGALSQLARG